MKSLCWNGAKVPSSCVRVNLVLAASPPTPPFSLFLSSEITDPLRTDVEILVQTPAVSRWASPTVIGICYIPVSTLTDSVDNWFHMKTRRNGEVKGFIRIKLDVLKNDRQQSKANTESGKELLNLLKTKALLDRQESRKAMARTIELPRTDRSKTILNSTEGGPGRESPRIIELPRTNDSPRFVDLSSTKLPSSSGSSAASSKQRPHLRESGKKASAPVLRVLKSPRAPRNRDPTKNSSKSRPKSDRALGFISPRVSRSKRSSGEKQRSRSRDDHQLEALTTSPPSPTESPAESPSASRRALSPPVARSPTQQLLDRISAASSAPEEPLDLSELNATEVPDEKDWPVALQSRLQELDLSFNLLSDLPSLQFLRSLRMLNLSANKISALLSSLGSLTSLEELRLTGNAIEYISPDIGKLVSLEKLYLQNNQIKSVPAQLTRLTKLEDLDLSGNPLADLPEEFVLPNLEVLDLNGCGLCALPESFSKCTRLLELDLGCNTLEHLPHNMGRLTRLSKLTLADNLLVDLPVSMGHCRGLRWLDLSRNPIRNEKMLERANVGTDHLVDWLERRMFALIDFDASSVFNDGLEETNEYGRPIRPSEPSPAQQLSPAAATSSPLMQASTSPSSPTPPRASLSSSAPDYAHTMANTQTAPLPRIGNRGAPRTHQQLSQRLVNSGSVDHSQLSQLEMLKAEYAAARSQSAGAAPAVQMGELPRAPRLSMYVRSQKQTSSGSAIDKDPEVQAILQRHRAGAHDPMGGTQTSQPPAYQPQTTNFARQPLQRPEMPTQSGVGRTVSADANVRGRHQRFQAAPTGVHAPIQTSSAEKTTGMATPSAVGSASATSKPMPTHGGMDLGGVASSAPAATGVRSHSPSSSKSRDDRSKRDRILSRRVGPLIQAGMANAMSLHTKLDMLKERAESATTTQYVLVVAKILATLKDDITSLKALLPRLSNVPLSYDVPAEGREERLLKIINTVVVAIMDVERVLIASLEELENCESPSTAINIVQITRRMKERFQRIQ